MTGRIRAESLSAMQPLFSRLKAVWHPAMYHGHGLRHDFFEGWYFKIADPSERRIWAVIPGVFLAASKGSSERSHAFVQTLDGASGVSFYHRYPLEAFEASRREFDVRIGPNRFRSDLLSLDIDRPEERLSGELTFDGVVPWPVRFASPGVMGWYALVPFMECYHGVLGFDHAIGGSLTRNGDTFPFTGGRGYIEKDWGVAFPRSWVWCQSNHFGETGACLTASVGHIPWLWSSFRGFIVGLLHRGILYRFATYTGARLVSLRIEDAAVHLHCADKRRELLIDARRSGGGLLHAPFRTAMLQRVLESLTAEVSVRLLEHPSGRELFSGTGRHAGLEVGGDIGLITGS